MGSVTIMKTIAVLLLVSSIAADSRVRRQSGAYAGVGGGFIGGSPAGQIGYGGNPAFGYSGQAPSAFGYSGQNPSAFGGLAGPAGYTGANYLNPAPLTYNTGHQQLGYNGRNSPSPVHNNGIYTGIHNRPYYNGGAAAAYTADPSGQYSGAPGLPSANLGAYNGISPASSYDSNGYSGSQYVPENHNGGQVDAYSGGHYPGGNNLAHARTDDVLVPRGGSHSGGATYAGGNVPEYDPSGSYTNGAGSSYEAENAPSYSGNNDENGNSYNFPSNSRSYSPQSGNRNLAGA